jgi:ribosome-binding factor A
VSRRTARLGEELREEVARIIASELKDPRIGFVTVTRVGLTPDLRNARIYVGVLGGDVERKKTLEGLRQAAGYLRRLLGQRLRLRHTPELLFEYDTGLDAADRVAQILEETKESERSAEGDGAERQAGEVAEFEDDVDGEDLDDDDDDPEPRG